MIVWFYFVLFLLSLLFLVLLSMQKQQIDFAYMLTFITLCIANGGYYAISQAHTLDAVQLAIKLTYFGGVFAPLFIFVAIMELCKIKVPQPLCAAMGAFALLVLGLVFTIDRNELYYSSTTIRQAWGGTYVVNEYGKLHFLYTLYLFVLNTSSIAVIVYTLFKKKKFSCQVSLCLLVMMLFTVAVCLLERVVSSPVEVLPLVYAGDLLCLLLLFRRIDMYDIKSNINFTTDTLAKTGFIIFDKRCRLISFNDFAAAVFPELKDCYIDRAIPKGDGFLSAEIVSWLEEYSGAQSVSMKLLPPPRSIVKGEQVYKCYLKFIRHGKLQKHVGYLFELTDYTREQEHVSLLNNYNTLLRTEVDAKTSHIIEMQNKMVIAMAALVESRDDSTGGHIIRTSDVVRIFMQELSKHQGLFPISDFFKESVIRAAPMHDLGKIAINDDILRKPEKYTDREFDEMKKHVVCGAEIVRKVLTGIEYEPFIKIAENMAHYHHEHWDGSGYPEGLRGYDIPLEARIMALADVFDALVSQRCYKLSYSYDKVFEIIEQSFDTQFDPVLGRIFLECRPELEKLYDEAKPKSGGEGGAAAGAGKS